MEKIPHVEPTSTFKFFRETTNTIIDHLYFIEQHGSNCLFIEGNWDSAVQDGDIVYLAADGKFYQASYNDDVKNTNIAYADFTNNRAIFYGVVPSKFTTYANGQQLYLNLNGKVTTTNTSVPIARVISGTTGLLAFDTISLSDIASKLRINQDLNLFTDAGFYLLSGTTLNLPLDMPSNGNYLVRVYQNHRYNQLVQEVVVIDFPNDGRSFIRTRNQSSQWGNWKNLGSSGSSGSGDLGGIEFNGVYWGFLVSIASGRTVRIEPDTINFPFSVGFVQRPDGSGVIIRTNEVRTITIPATTTGDFFLVLHLTSQQGSDPTWEFLIKRENDNFDDCITLQKFINVPDSSDLVDDNLVHASAEIGTSLILYTELMNANLQNVVDIMSNRSRIEDLEAKQNIYAAMPVGIESWFPSINIPDGFLDESFNHGELSRETLPDLWKFAEASGNIVTDAVWLQEVIDNGACGHFSYGDSSTTFRIPYTPKVYFRSTGDGHILGTYEDDTMRPITGETRSSKDVGQVRLSDGFVEGAFTTGNTPISGYPSGGIGSENRNLRLDSSLLGVNYDGTETKPKTVVRVPIIKAYDYAIMPSKVNLDGLLKENQSLKRRLPNVTAMYNPFIVSTKRGLVMRENTYINLYINEGGVKKTIYYDNIDEWDTENLQLYLDAGSAFGAGKDYNVFLGAKRDDGYQVRLIVSLNDVPDGYTTGNIRLIGGFHTLCLDVGTITNHPLSGYITGDILPASPWDITHLPTCSPKGMVYNEQIAEWQDIYLQSGTRETTASVFGGVIADTRTYSQHIEDLFWIGKTPMTDEGFASGADWSNQGTNIRGSADPVTTGAHYDTANRRMISGIGLEDCCGAMAQWLSGWSYGSNHAASWVSDGGKGQVYQTNALLAGGDWSSGVICGSRSRHAVNSRLCVHAVCGCRGRARSRYPMR